MKTIGLIGGMSWESSIEYYRIINEETKKRLGGLHNAVSLMHTVDFAAIEVMQRENRWSETDDILVDAARKLEAGGADFIVLCTNTMHKSAEKITAAVNIPFLHIADATAKKVCDAGISRIALLGTRYTMEEDFYVGRLKNKFGLEVLIPEKDDRDEVHRVIFEELVQGKIMPESKRFYLEIIQKLADRGAGGVILGCTEIGLLVKPADTFLPVFDTTVLHAVAAVDLALAEY